MHSDLDFNLPTTPPSPRQPMDQMPMQSPHAAPLSVEEVHAQLTADIEHLLVTNLSGQLVGSDGNLAT